jgi:anti-anti-sigma regulatory factor
LYAEASYDETVLQLGKGDRVFFYTDGLLDAGAETTAREALAAEIARRDLPNSELLRTLHAKVEGSEDAGDRDDLTLMLIEAGEADSHFDVIEPAPAAPLPSAEAKAKLSCGESVAAAFIRVAGRVTWMRSQAFHDAACGYLESGRALILDLGECEYLDSTLLGTIHEIVVRGGGAVRLQGVRDEVRQLFEELSMHTVLEHVHPSVTGLPPTMNPLSQSSDDAERRNHRVLRAHEVLASLSDDNREEFRDLVESLQRELAASGE